MTWRSAPRCRTRSTRRGQGRSNGLQQLDAVAERVGDEGPFEAGQRFVVHRRMPGGCAAPKELGEIGDEQGGMRLPRRTEVVLDAEVNLRGASLEPCASAHGEVRRLRQFGQSEKSAVERPRLGLAPSRHRKLYVMNANDRHQL